jgi:hypothetical protein
MGFEPYLVFCSTDTRWSSTAGRFMQRRVLPLLTACTFIDGLKHVGENTRPQTYGAVAFLSRVAILGMLPRWDPLLRGAEMPAVIDCADTTTGEQLLIRNISSPYRHRPQCAKHPSLLIPSSVLDSLAGRSSCIYGQNLSSRVPPKSVLR